MEIFMCYLHFNNRLNIYVIELDINQFILVLYFIDFGRDVFTLYLRTNYSINLTSFEMFTM